MYEHYTGYTEDEHEQYLNTIYKDVKIGPLEFKPGKIFRRLNPVAFKCSFYTLKKGV